MVTTDHSEKKKKRKEKKRKIKKGETRYYTDD